MAVADSVATTVGVAVAVAVLANDTDPDGGTLSVSSVTGGSNGLVTLAGALATYTPNAGFVGSDSFTYVVSDGQGGTATGAVSVSVGSGVSEIPQGQMSVASVSTDPANGAAVLDGNSATRWGPSGGGPHEMILALGSSYAVSEFRYLPFTWAKCTQYEVYVSSSNGSWGAAVATGTWANNGTEKIASFAPTTGSFLRILYLDDYCYAAEHKVYASGGS